MNAFKNGTRTRLNLGELPKKMYVVTKKVRAYRRALEEAVEEVHGEVSFVAAHYVDSACKFEQVAGVCLYQMKRRIDDMSPSDVRECVAAIAKAAEKRNESVKALDLEKEPLPPWQQSGAFALLDKEEDHQHEDEDSHGRDTT